MIGVPGEMVYFSPHSLLRAAVMTKRDPAGCSTRLSKYCSPICKLFLTYYNLLNCANGIIITVRCACCIRTSHHSPGRRRRRWDASPRQDLSIILHARWTAAHVRAELPAHPVLVEVGRFKVHTVPLTTPVRNFILTGVPSRTIVAEIT